MKKKLLLNEIRQLDKDERTEIGKLIRQLDDDNKIISMIESPLDEKNHCPHCGGEKHIKYGFAYGLQRYHCRACRKTFNTLTGTPLARLRRKDNWLEYLGTICNSQTIRSAAKQV